MLKTGFVSIVLLICGLAIAQEEGQEEAQGPAPGMGMMGKRKCKDGMKYRHGGIKQGKGCKKDGKCCKKEHRRQMEERLDLIDARLAKIEAMLESLMRR